MYNTTKLLAITLLLTMLGCSANSSKNVENSTDSAIVKEIQSLDSVSQTLEKSTLEIEANIKSVESAIDALDDL